MGIVNLRLVVLSLVAILPLGSAFAKKPLSSVADLRYGVALFHYYQGEYINALTELLVAKEKGGIKGHGDNPEIMEGGFSLAYGMERHASDIFERLLEENRPVNVRDSAWFYLSKLRYLREDWPASQDALDRVSKSPDKSIRADVFAQKVNLAIKRENLDLAARLLKKDRARGGWAPYLYFNLGSAYARNQQYENAIDQFNRLRLRKDLADEHKALFDQAMTAAGYSSIFSDKYPAAISYFSKVRLTSALSNNALLGYGWAAAEMGDYREALKPWVHLSSQTLIDENSLEALVAVPYAYEQLGAEGQALNAYKGAEEKFNEEIARLDEVIETMQGDTMLQALQIEGSRGLDWLKYAENNELAPRLSYLADLFAKEAFQGFVQELRDLIAIKNNLLEWQEKLGFYEQIIFQRQDYRNNKEEVLAAGNMENEIGRIKRKRDFIAAELERIRSEKDFFAIADEEKSEFIDRLSRAKQNIELLRDTDPFIDESEEMVRWYHGILMWQSAEEFADRTWKTEKALAQLDRALNTTRGNYDLVENIIKDAPDLDPKKQLVKTYQDLIEIQLAEVDLAIDTAKFDLSSDIVSVLKSQKQRVNQYLGQSRLSIARLYDKANPGVWGDEPEEPLENTESDAGVDLEENVETNSSGDAAP